MSRPSPLRRILRWRTFFRLVMLALAGMLVWSTLTVQGRTFARSLLFVPNLIPGSPVHPLGAFTRAPSRLDVSFTDAAESWPARLYLPATGGPHPGIVVALGVNQAGLDDPRVVHLAEGLARMGVAALVPHSDTLTAKRVTPREIDFMVAAYRYLEGRPEIDPRRVGFLGVCVGSSLSLLAAEDPRIADRVSFVSWFGGYYRLQDLVVSVATRTYQADGRLTPWAPDALTEDVVRRSIQESFGDELLQRLFASSPEEAQAILEQAPPQAQDLLRALSPAGRLDRLSARVYVMDDTGDPLIPYVESRALAHDLGPRLARTSEFTVFSHVDLNRLGNPARSVPELWSLFLHVHAIFQSLR